MTVHDPYDLGRFVAAQEAVYARVCAELADGRKRTHWMWFIFPQLRGLGSSPTAQRFGLGSLEEARAYLAHPLLGARLRECAALVNALPGASAETIFGSPDELKFRSCMTLFACAAGELSVATGAGGAAATRGAQGTGERVFSEALAKYCAGESDRLTLELLGL